METVLERPFAATEVVRETLVQSRLLLTLGRLRTQVSTEAAPQAEPSIGFQAAEITQGRKRLVLLYGRWLLVGAQGTSCAYTEVVGLVLAEDYLDRWDRFVHVEMEIAQRLMRQFYSLLLRNIGHGRLRLGVLFRPGPGVSKPCLWEQAQLCLLGAAVVGCDLHQCIVQVSLGILDNDIEVLVFIQDPRVEQLVLQQLRVLLSFEVHSSKLVVGILNLRVLVHHLHVTVCGHGIQVVIELLDILTMITLRI
mmetsp:Transcript_112061/g.267310  ORF Transcript_112061/g.267310 Transcript_112061/m.267310 type:complete len:251 (-) Transcript_112061:6-758(-)